MSDIMERIRILEAQVSILGDSLGQISRIFNEQQQCNLDIADHIGEVETKIDSLLLRIIQN